MQNRNGEGLYRSQVFLEAFLDFSSTQHCTRRNLEGQKKTESGQKVREVGDISKARLSCRRQQEERWVQGLQRHPGWAAVGQGKT